MKYSKKQLRAMYYSERKRRIERVKKAGLWCDYVDSGYKSLCWFLRSVNRMDLY